jgi:hypothetical protein
LMSPIFPMTRVTCSKSRAVSARDRGGTGIGRVADVWQPPGPHCKSVAAIRDVQPERARRPRRDVFKGKHQAEGKIMRIFVTGATGALGRHLVPGLVAAGHEVTATTRTPGKVAQLREAGAEPVVLDGLDREAVIAAVQAAAPEVVVHQLRGPRAGQAFRRCAEDRRRSARLAAHPVGWARAGGDQASRCPWRSWCCWRPSRRWSGHGAPVRPKLSPGPGRGLGSGVAAESLDGSRAACVVVTGRCPAYGLTIQLRRVGPSSATRGTARHAREQGRSRPGSCRSRPGSRCGLG